MSPLKVRAPCSPETDIRVDGEPNKLTIKLEDDGREGDGREEEGTRNLYFPSFLLFDR